MDVKFNRSILVRISYFIVNLILLNTVIVLGSVLSIGLLFIPLTVGAMYMFRKIVIHDSYYFWKDFYKGFKDNLKTSMKLSIVMIILSYLLWITIANINIFNISIIGYICAFIITYCMFILWIYGSAIIARFDVKLSRVINFSFLIGNGHIFSTIALLILLGIFGSIYNYFNYLIIFIIVALYLFISSFLVFNIFKKYEPK